MTQSGKQGSSLHREQPKSHGWSADGAVIISSFRNVLSQQELLCDRLELIADSLPDNADIHGCLQTAQGIVPVVKKAHEFEEYTVYPYLSQAHTSDEKLHSTLDRLRFEHLGDEEFATDLTHALRQFAIAPEQSNVESLAWMLRGFFEALRRHVAFEREHVLPLVMTKVGH